MLLKARLKWKPAIAHGESHILFGPTGRKDNPLMLGYVVKFRAEKENVTPSPTVTSRHTGQGAFNICLQQETRVENPPRV